MSALATGQLTQKLCYGYSKYLRPVVKKFSIICLAHIAPKWIASVRKGTLHLMLTTVQHFCSLFTALETSAIWLWQGSMETTISTANYKVLAMSTALMESAFQKSTCFKPLDVPKCLTAFYLLSAFVPTSLRSGLLLPASHYLSTYQVFHNVIHWWAVTQLQCSLGL